VTLHLLGLNVSPPGLYQDEAAFGYNAWAIAHYGVDEWGHRLPLFLQSFDDYKSPLYAYLLAPLTWIQPLDVVTTRLPAAVCDLAACAFLAVAALRLTRSRLIGLLTLLTAGFMPWLVLQGRVAFDVTTMTLTLSGAVWCLVEAEQRRSARWFTSAGIFLGLAVFSYQSARLLAALLLASLCAVHITGLLSVRRRRQPSAATNVSAAWMCALPPALFAYLLLGLWSAHHPGALLARFNSVSILNDHPSLLVAAGRFIGNYLSYFNLPFLVLTGDTNPRHGTGFGGVVLVAMLAPLIAGVVVWVRHRSEPIVQLLALGLLTAPVPAALSSEGSPHAVRAAGMIPFLVILAACGWSLLLPILTRRRRLAAGVAALAAVQVGLYLTDLFLLYPGRAQQAFEAGQREAIVRAHELAGEHRVLLSKTLGEPYAQALFALAPPPTASREETLARLGVSQLEPARLEAVARRGDLVVLAPTDTPPARADHLLVERVPAPLWLGEEPAVAVYRID
jgi:4-amino-4-deoxy-L-arabinose transferase-like glycosyltransferase